jgi:hypothetical protein
MHDYLKSIGFRGIDNDDYRMVLHDIVAHPDEQLISDIELGEERVEYRKEYALNMGIAVSGYLDEEDGFVKEFSYPYFTGVHVSENENIKLEKITDRDAYYGLIEDNSLGIDLIFYDQDSMSEIQGFDFNKELQKTPVRLSGLAESGKILLPLTGEKKPEINESIQQKKKELYEGWRNGDADAIEELQNQEIEAYGVISERIKSEDVMTIVSNYIMPVGIECDKYGILGDIESHEVYINKATRQMVHVLSVRCSDIVIDVCINDKDLKGDIKVNRRFKGDIWLQGKIL